MISFMFLGFDSSQAGHRIEELGDGACVEVEEFGDQSG